MIDAAGFKQTLKDASDDEAKALYIWATACMEVRGLIDIAGAPATRKRRSDAGTERKPRELLTQDEMKQLGIAQPTVEAVRERLQSSLSGLPDEMGVEK